MRNHKIIALKAEIKTNDVLLPRLHAIASDVEENGPAKFSSYVEQLKTNPSPAGPEPEPGMELEPPAPGRKKLTYDEMILSLLLKVYDDAREKGVAKGSENQEKLREALVANLREHEKKLGERQETCKKDLAQEEKEKAKKITSEDIHDGFDSGVRMSFDSDHHAFKLLTDLQCSTSLILVNLNHFTRARQRRPRSMISSF